MNIKTISLIIIMVIIGYFAIENASEITLGKATEPEPVQEETLPQAKINKNEKTVTTIEKDEILNTEDDRPVVLLFTADWCSACKKFKPVFAKTKSDIGNGYRYVEVNVDKNPKLANYFKIRSIPTLYIFDKKNRYKAKVDMYHLDAELKNYLLLREH